jgi:thymidylate synthase (FAD)
LTPILGRKRAKESARFFKTFNSQIDMDVMFNFRSFVHFQRLRNSEHAQLEVRELAQMMLDLVKGIEGNPFQHTLEAFKL